jgi:hypothetical protein
MGLTDIFPWLKQELQELNRARVGAIAVLVLGIGVGFTAGGFYFQSLYAERIALFERQLAAAKDQVDYAEKRLRDQAGSAQAPLVTGIGDLIMAWGAGVPKRCSATVSGRGLAAYEGKFGAILICGAARGDTDRLTDIAITVSPVFSIQSNFTVDVPISEAMRDMLARISASPMPQGKAMSLNLVAWYEVAVIPKGLDPSAIHALADIERVGGKRFPDQSRSIVVNVPLVKK